MCTMRSFGNGRSLWLSSSALSNTSCADISTTGSTGCGGGSGSLVDESNRRWNKSFFFVGKLCEFRGFSFSVLVQCSRGEAVLRREGSLARRGGDGLEWVGKVRRVILVRLVNQVSRFPWGALYPLSDRSVRRRHFTMHPQGKHFQCARVGPLLS